MPIDENLGQAHSLRVSEATAVLPIENGKVGSGNEDSRTGTEWTGRDFLRQELEHMLAERDLLDKKIEAHRKALAALEINVGEGSGIGLIPPDIFQGMHVRDAISKLLRLLHQDAIGIPEAVPLLLRGGANLGRSPERHQRTLTITVSMNSDKRNPSHLFDFDRKNNVVTIRPRHRTPM